MPVFKNEDNGTWYVMARYVNWKGERKQKCKGEFIRLTLSSDASEEDKAAIIRTGMQALMGEEITL